MEDFVKQVGPKLRKGPVVLTIMDGVGLAPDREGDAFANAHTPFIDSLFKSVPCTKLKAHGKSVGLPSDKDMGNSEVGHNALGSGRVFLQGAALVEASIQNEKIYDGEGWKKISSNCLDKGSTLHFIGLLSDGNVHSHIRHLLSMLSHAKKQGISRVRVHILLDGRDVPATSSLTYVDQLEKHLSSLNDSSFDSAIASGGGRMVVTMDRYEADWKMVERGWAIQVHGDGRGFNSAKEAIETLRSETADLSDQYIPPFVITKDGSPVGTIEDGDSVVLFNFRGDRALEITKAFEAGKDFDKFDRGRIPSVCYAGMMEYDGDLKIPQIYLVEPPAIDHTLAQYLSNAKVRQLAISETQKYGHVTYFFDGNRWPEFDKNLQARIEIQSDNVPFDQKPAMKCKEITDKLEKAISSGEYDFIIVNYPNGDMVGHTGNYEAAMTSMEALDVQIKRLASFVEKAGGIMLLTADHGNCDEMYMRDKNGNIEKDSLGRIVPKTAHSLSPVPFFIYDPSFKAGDYSQDLVSGLALTSMGSTVLELLGFEPPKEYDAPIIKHILD